MTGGLALKIEAAQQRVAALECSLRVYRAGFPAAAARVAEQLDDAALELARLEREAGR